MARQTLLFDFAKQLGVTNQTIIELVVVCFFADCGFVVD